MAFFLYLTSFLFFLSNSLAYASDDSIEAAPWSNIEIEVSPWIYDSSGETNQFALQLCFKKRSDALREKKEAYENFCLTDEKYGMDLFEESVSRVLKKTYQFPSLLVRDYDLDIYFVEKNFSVPTGSGAVLPVILVPIHYLTGGNRDTILVNEKIEFGISPQFLNDGIRKIYFPDAGGRVQVMIRNTPYSTRAYSKDELLEMWRHFSRSIKKNERRMNKSKERASFKKVDNKSNLWRMRYYFSIYMEEYLHDLIVEESNQ